MPRIVLFATILLCCPLLMLSPAHAWWNGDWNARMKITADAGPKGANVTQPIGRTQVLIRLHSGNFNFDTARENGDDLRVIAGDDRTPLHFHIERYDGLVDQVGLIWVDVPDLAPNTATSFYLYWGNKNAQPGGDPKATYDPDQLLVYHFGEENGVPHDSTGYGNNALTAGKRDDGGMVGYGLRLDGTAPVQIPASPSLTIAQGAAMTFSAWTRLNDGVKSGVIYSERDGQNTFSFGIDQGVAYAEIETPDGKVRTSAGVPVPDGYHLITVTTGTTLRVYVDGEPRGEATVTMPALNAVGYLGGMPAATPSPAPAAAPAAAPAGDAAPAAGAAAPAPAAPDANAPATPADAPAQAQPAAPPNFVGVLDEFRISKVNRPPGAFKIEVASEGPKPFLLTFDVPEQSSVFGNSYFGIIIKSVTPDAWVVISILGVMALISWVTMVSKAIYLSRINAANHLFRVKFREAMRKAGGQNIGAFSPGGERKLTRSPLFRLYRLGVSEVEERISLGRLDADGRLPMQSLAAIRSALDGAFARENQRLNNRMVLLTIAISGGPFLGLLGTVVGVMITFAAIAAAGDVNINAIAPGISAALLATVAGLAVAIPSLFGYNYFTIRIRDSAVDMQVFIDELVTRMGEGIDLAPHAPSDTAIGE